MKEKILALIYCRVSSQRQVIDGHGLDSQEQRCKKYASMKDYKVVRVFPDEGISGGLFERPAMKNLIEYLDSHPLEKFVVIFDDLSRFARDVKVHIQLKAELVSRGVKLECLNFNYDESDESEMAELMLAVSNQYQRKANRRQVIQKQKARLERGYWAFSTPRALVSVKDPIHGKILRPREPYASIYKRAIESYRDGLLVRPDDVKKYIDEEYEKQHLDKVISLTAARDLLSEILYAGYIEYKPWKVELKKAQHSGFISLETYSAVQERLSGRSKPWKRRDYSHDFPLRPHVLCATCEKPMTASWNRGRKTRYPNYFCRTKGCQYNWKVVRKDKLEIQFEDLLRKVRPDGELDDLTKHILLEQWDIRMEKLKSRRVSFKKEVDEITTSIDTFLKRISRATDNGIIDMYEEEIIELKKRRNQIEQSLEKEYYTSGEFGTASEKILNTLKDPMSMWKSEEYSNKRIILFMYFEDKLKFDYKTGFGTANLAYPIKLMADIKSAKSDSVEMSGSDPESEK